MAVFAQDDAIVGVKWGVGGQSSSAILRRASLQIEQYFSGEIIKFDLPLRVNGSQFQKDVCAVMSGIPFGETITYGDIAKRLNVPAQAVGQACGGNPIPLIIPCHRVLGATGLGGFSGGGGGINGIELKVQLLRHEGAAGLLI